MVDTGVDPTLRDLRHTHVVQRGFGGGDVRPAAHGDAVASLIADQMSGGGAGGGSELYVADMFSAGPQSGSAVSLIGGLSWLAQSGLPVINISLTGPPNPVVAKVVQNLAAKGVVLVAAAGNDGVAAPPAFPAAYPEVVAVTAVDRSRRPYHYANRGAYLMFSALGVDVMAGGPGDSPQTVSGTSFASPIVAVELARRLSKADAAGARKALQALAAEAIDLGPPGRDPIFGYGLVESRP
jgi:subtilisin family serine protease